MKYAPYLAGQVSTVQATFTNVYTPKLVTYTPKVIKNLTGDTAPSDSTFRFDLALKSEPVKGAAVLAADPGASIVGAGTVELPEITFRVAGKYTFTVTERKGNLYGFTYDTSVWTLTVEVKEDANGDLIVEIAGFKLGLFSGTSEAASFTNKYRRKDPPDEPGTPPTTPTPPPENRYYLPKNGDDSKLGIWVATLAAAAGGLVWLKIRRRKDTGR